MGHIILGCNWDILFYFILFYFILFWGATGTSYFGVQHFLPESLNWIAEINDDTVYIDNWK